MRLTHVHDSQLRVIARDHAADANMDSVAADQIVEDSGIIDSNTLQTSKEDTSKLGIVNNRE